MKMLVGLLLLFAGCSLLIACGQTGRLYLPKQAVLINTPSSNNLANPPSNSGTPV